MRSTAIYTTSAFNTKLQAANRPLPKVHLIAKNQYMGPASAYAAVLSEIEVEIAYLMVQHPNRFTFKKIEVGTCEIKDFQTTGVVAFAKGLPFSNCLVYYIEKTFGPRFDGPIALRHENSGYAIVEPFDRVVEMIAEINSGASIR